MPFTRKQHLWVLPMFLAGLLPAACGPRFEPAQVPRMHWAIMPFEQPASMTTHPRAVRGWWLSAWTLRQDPRSGRLLAETIARGLAGREYINLYPMLELRYYLEEKEQRLRESYPYLEEQEIQQLIGEVPPEAYGRELGVDKLLTGRIVRHHMGQNRVFYWWWSVLEAEVSVVDVSSGEREWARDYHYWRLFDSQLALQQTLAEDLARDLEREYFQPLTKR